MSSCARLPVALIRCARRGLCRSHYDRDRYSGSPLKPLRQRMCPQCHTWFDPKRSDQLFCSGVAVWRISVLVMMISRCR